MRTAIVFLSIYMHNLVRGTVCIVTVTIGSIVHCYHKAFLETSSQIGFAKKVFNLQPALSKCLKIYQLFLGCLVTSEQKLFNHLIRKVKTTYNSDGGLNHVTSPPQTPLAKQIRQHYNLGIEGVSSEVI